MKLSQLVARSFDAQNRRVSELQAELDAAYLELAKIRPVRAIFDREVWDKVEKLYPRGRTS